MKNKSYGRLAVAAAAVCMLFGGCSGGRELSAEEETAVAEYAAGLLLKYDSKYPDRLLPEEEVARREKENAQNESVQKESAENESAENESAENENIENAGTETGALTNEEGEHAAEGLLGAAPGIRAELVGAGIFQNYPEAGGAYILEASEGNHILVCELALKNEQDQALAVDVIAASPTITISVNDSVTRTALMTMLPDDLTTYAGNIGAGEEKHFVLLTEIPDRSGEKIDHVRITLENGGRKAVLDEISFPEF